MVHGNATSMLLPARWPTPRLPLPSRLPRLLPELLLLAGVNAVYKYGRKVANHHPEEAVHHADHVWSLERTLHLPSEHSVQDLLLHSHTLTHGANVLYATVHFPAMVAFLGYMFARHRAHYLWIRRAIVIQTMLALLGHLFFPLAPPRLFPTSHMVDTAQLYGPSVYGSKPDTGSMANQFAAMPSLHVGWALAIAVGLISATRSRLRHLWLLHPLLTLLVVVSTANHYWLDGVVGSALLGLALMVIPGPEPESESGSDPGSGDGSRSRSGAGSDAAGSGSGSRVRSPRERARTRRQPPLRGVGGAGVRPRRAWRPPGPGRSGYLAQL
jgi:hypothetical protein